MSQAWSRFAEEGLLYEESGSNTRYDFTKMCKKFGKPYIDYLIAAYSAKDDMTNDEFCTLNGQVPVSFLEKKIVT